MASVSDYIGTKASALWTGTIGSGGVSDDSTQTIPLSSVTGLTNGEVYFATIDRVDSNGTSTPALREVVKGVLSGSNLIDCTRGVEGTAQQHNAGKVVEILFTAAQWNDLQTGLLVEHNTDGTHKALTNTSLTTPKITTSINDSNGNEIIKTPATASAVNEITVTNAATGNAPKISATGGDTNVALKLSGKSAGVVATGIYDNGNSGTSKAIDWSMGDVQKVTLTGDCTFTYSNAVSGQRLTLLLIENSTGGYSITLPTSKYPGGTTPTYTTTANAINAIVVIYDGTNYLTQAAVGFA